jgi:pimeloyl-ACP methyl ester carboxylesterase
MDLITETPVLFGRNRSLVGIISEAARADCRGDGPAAVFISSGIIHRMGPNRLYVDFARALARAGIWSLRFDLGGIGDSWLSKTERGTLPELAARDISDAIAFALERSGAESVVLIGLCSGADHALRTAISDPRVSGAVLLDPNVHRPFSHTLHRLGRGLTSGRTWQLLLTGEHPVFDRLRGRNIGGVANVDADLPVLVYETIPTRAQVQEWILQVLRRGCRLFFLFTGGIPDNYNHREQLLRAYPGLRGAVGLKLDYVKESDHTLSHPAHRQSVIETAVAWVTQSAPMG